MVANTETEDGGRDSAVADAWLGSRTNGLSQSPRSDTDIRTVVAHGDLVLHFEHPATKTTAAYLFRVSSAALMAHSKYFERLLQPGRFAEGSQVEAQHSVLRQRYHSMAEVPSVELPVFSLKDMGRISTVKALDALCLDFLHILHDKDMQAFPPVANLANLAIVADRFDALNIVKSYVRRKKMIRAIEGRTTPKSDEALSEEKVRQRLLVAMLLDNPMWIEKYSARLIIKGWTGRDVDLSRALWWDLPARMEEEIAGRRDYILDTILSVQTYFLGLYTSRERQCKLFYDSSAHCDSYQLGEMVRFFSRIRTLRLPRTIFEDESRPAALGGDLLVLLDRLREVSEYQIDGNHKHCGIRIRLIPVLDLLQESLRYIGVCPDCWSEDRSQHAWIEQKRPLVWNRQHRHFRTQGIHNIHADVRGMFMASERDWAA